MISNFIKKWRAKISKIADNIFVDKYNCIVCDKELHGQKRSGICEKCLSEMNMLTDNICNKCGEAQNNEAEYCISCQNHPKNFDKARSCFVFEGNARALVHRLKFGKARYVSKYMANCMVDRYLECGFDSDIVVPIPLSKKHQKKRGYNQAELLGKYISEQLHLPMCVDAVAKIRDTEEQARKSGVERMLNVLDAYAIIDAKEIKGKKILLVDDVLSTGSTSSEVAKMLYKAKVSEVLVLTFCSTKYIIQSETYIGGVDIEN